MKTTSITCGDQLESIWENSKEPMHKFGEIIKNGRTLYDGYFEFLDGKKELSVIDDGEEPIRYHVDVVKEQGTDSRIVSSFSPYITEGITVEMEIEDAFVDKEHPFEAIIKGNYGVRSFYFYDPLYFKNKGRYKRGKTINITLSAFIYFIEEVEDKEFKLDWDEKRRKEMGMELEYNEDGTLKPVIIDNTKLRFLIPNDKFYGDYWFQSPLISYETINREGKEILKIKLDFEADDGMPLLLRGYIRQNKVNMDDLTPNNPLTGNLLLQGTIADTFELLEKDVRENEKLEKENKGKKEEQEEEESDEDLKINKELYHCIKILGEAHKACDFSKFYNLLDDKVHFHSSIKHIKTIKGKENVIEFYDNKDKPNCVYYNIVTLRGIDDLLDEKDMMFQKGKLCLALFQLFEGSDKINRFIVHLNINKKGLIDDIFITLYEDYKTDLLRLPRFKDDKAEDWYPLYEEDNIYNYQELNNIALSVAIDRLLDHGYEIMFLEENLDFFPNLAVRGPEEENRILLFSIRGFHPKDLKGKRVNGLYPEEVYSQNLLDQRLRDKFYNIALEAGAEYHIIQCYFSTDNEDHMNKGLLMRGDKIIPDVCWLEPGDFKVNKYLTPNEMEITDEELSDLIENAKSGELVLITRTGWIFKGEGRKGLPHGHGIRFHKDGREFEGEFDGLMISGKGRVRLSDGIEHIGKWENSVMEVDSTVGVGKIIIHMVSPEELGEILKVQRNNDGGISVFVPNKKQK